MSSRDERIVGSAWSTIALSVAFSIAVSTASSAAQANDGDAATMREQGLVEYEIGHYREAVLHFRRAADAGDARSAEILCLMYRLGPTLYGGQVAASPVEAARWAARAADGRVALATTAGAAGR